MRNRLLHSFVVAAAVATALAQPSQTHASPINLVQNGNFATGDLTRWSNPDGFWFVPTLASDVHLSPAPRNGNIAATAGGFGFGGLGQTLATQAGATYDLSFAYNPGQSTSLFPAALEVLWNGKDVLDINGGSPQWNLYIVKGLLGAAGGATSLVVEGEQAYDTSGITNFDVSAVPNPTPLPATWAMMLTGLAGLGFLAMRRKSFTASQSRVQLTDEMPSSEPLSRRRSLVRLTCGPQPCVKPYRTKLGGPNSQVGCQ